MADDMVAHPNMWTDGSRDEDLDALVGVAGLVPLFGQFLGSLMVGPGVLTGDAQDLDLVDDAARIFSMVPDWLQTVQRAEYGRFILALQAFTTVHSGTDNKNCLL